LISCDKEDIKEDIVDSHKREGVIKLYTNGSELVFSEITEYPFVKISSGVAGYDTIGVAYTGYVDKSYSIIGSIEIIILHNNLELYYVDYRYPTSENVATSFRTTIDNPDDTYPLEYNIKEQKDVITGRFNAVLYSGIIDIDGPETIVIDSCFFSIKK